MAYKSTRGQFLPRVPFRPLEPSEPIVGTADQTVRDYWRWASSDVLENTQRGVFAEFLVAAAIGKTRDRRIGWASFDLDYDSFKIEVKTSAYLQAWPQRKLSNPNFTIGVRRPLDESGIDYEADPRRIADCYVFCLYGDKDPLDAKILDVCRWQFYVVPISRLIQECDTAETVSLNRLNGFANPMAFDALKSNIDLVRGNGDLIVTGILKAPDHSHDAGPKRNLSGSGLRTYVVARRKTREHPVIVQAADYKSAHLLARSDPTLASFGSNVSAFALTREEERQALISGAKDLRITLDTDIPPN